MIIGKESSSSELNAENSSPGTLGLIMRRPVSYLSACILIMIFLVRFYQNANTTHKINLCGSLLLCFSLITGRKGGRPGGVEAEENPQWSGVEVSLQWQRYGYSMKLNMVYSSTVLHIWSWLPRTFL